MDINKAIRPYADPYPEMAALLVFLPAFPAFVPGRQKGAFQSEGPHFPLFRKIWPGSFDPAGFVCITGRVTGFVNRSMVVMSAVYSAHAGMGHALFRMERKSPQA